MATNTPDMENLDTSDVKLMYDNLARKSKAYTELFDYYDGNHPMKFLTRKLRDLFQRIDVKFSENWCGVVVDAMLERINLHGISLVTDDQSLQDQINRLWNSLNMQTEADETHEAALVTGEAFIVAGERGEDELEALARDNIGEGQEMVIPRTEAYFNDPRMCHAIYYNDDPHRLRVVGKWWVDDRGRRRLKLYYDDHFEEWVSKGKADKVESAKAFLPATNDEDSDWWEPNPYPIIPVFHFRTRRRRCMSEIENVLEPQNAINKLLNDMMAAAEYAAFKQRWIITQAEIPEGALDKGPGSLWEIPAGEGLGEGTSVGEFGETNLLNFLEPIKRQVFVIATLTRTPKHYFIQDIAAPSGEALLTIEAPLNKKCDKRIDSLKPTWKKLWQFILFLEGQSISQDIINPAYSKPETIQPLTVAQIRQSSRSAGLALATVLEREGWSRKEIEAAQAEIELEQEKMLEFEARRQAMESAAMGNAFERIQAGQNQAQTIREGDDETG